MFFGLDPRIPISPLEGEMPFRAEGGCADKHQEKLLHFLHIQWVVIVPAALPPSVTA